MMIDLISSAKKTDVYNQIVFKHVVRSIKIVLELTNLCNFETQIT